MKTIGQWLNDDKTISYRDKEYILQHILKKSRVNLHLSLNHSLSSFQLAQIHRLSDFYKKGVPLAYLLGETDFYGHTFFVDRDVFIPRPETEFLVNAVVHYFSEEKFSNTINQPFYIMDFGCGSGCIGLSLLLHFRKAHLFAVDVHSRVLNCTYKNAKALGVVDRISIVHSDVSQLNPKDFPPIYWITANPPYVEEGDPHVGHSVLGYEPHGALFSGEKGLENIQIWLNQAVSFLLYSHSQLLKNQKAVSLPKTALKTLSCTERKQKIKDSFSIENKFSGFDPPDLSHTELSYFFEIGYNQYSRVSRILKDHSKVSSFQHYLDQQGIQRIFQCSVQ